jgi:hypothetical protein
MRFTIDDVVGGTICDGNLWYMYNAVKFGGAMKVEIGWDAVGPMITVMLRDDRNAE